MCPLYTETHIEQCCYYAPKREKTYLWRDTPEEKRIRYVREERFGSANGESAEAVLKWAMSKIDDLGTIPTLPKEFLISQVESPFSVLTDELDLVDNPSFRGRTGLNI